MDMDLSSGEDLEDFVERRRFSTLRSAVDTQSVEVRNTVKIRLAKCIVAVISGVDNFL